MKILAICSSTDFINFTRRATINAIACNYNNLDVMLFSGIKNLFKKKGILKGYKFYFFHYLLPITSRKILFLANLENFFLKLKWDEIFTKYDVIFFSDPNQYFLLNFLTKKHKVIYLIRDPNVLQNPKNKPIEEGLIQRADIVLGTSKNLAYEYVKKFYGLNKKNIYYWANTVDFKNWHSIRLLNCNVQSTAIGVAGNLNSRTDLYLLKYLLVKLKYVNIEIYGKNNLKDKESDQFLEILKSKKIDYKGYVPYDQLPGIVNSWRIGITLEKKCEYTHFTHHNKIYQYMALGIPVVTLRTHDDYEDYCGAVFLADDYQEFVSHVNYLINLSNENMEKIRQKCVDYARQNSSENRAKQFMSILNKAFVI